MVSCLRHRKLKLAFRGLRRQQEEAPTIPRCRAGRLRTVAVAVTRLLPFLLTMVTASSFGEDVRASTSNEARCSRGVAVADASASPGLVADCVALLDAKDGLMGDSPTAELNWSSGIPVAMWDGVTLGGDPIRVTGLSLHRRNLSGVIPEELGRLGALIVLSLSGNELAGVIPVELRQLGKLKGLTLSRNRLTGAIPAELGQLRDLESLYLHDNQLTGSVPEELGQLLELKWLVIGRNQLRGPIPETLGRLRELRVMDLGHNRLTGPIPGALGHLANLTALTIANNEISGDIPSGLSRLTNLVRLSLDDNQLTGSIPPELGQLRELRSLHLRANDLTGSIPEELGQLSELVGLDLSHNRLKGHIPEELGQLDNLERLSLNNNRLTGSIPPRIGDLTALKELDVASNGLTGRIPDEFRKIATSKSLSLSDNPLTWAFTTGPVPPFRHSGFSTNIITWKDPTAFLSLSNGEREHAFMASYIEGDIIDIRIDVPYWTARKAESLARMYAVIIGQIPHLLRACIEVIYFDHETPNFGALESAIYVPAMTGWPLYRRTMLEEIMVHEAAHACLDESHEDTPGWLAAQEHDGAFVTDYAGEYPHREDIAESFVAYFAVDKRAMRIEEDKADAIRFTIPNRLAYFDGLSFEGQWCPVVVEDCPREPTRGFELGAVSERWGLMVLKVGSSVALAASAGLPLALVIAALGEFLVTGLLVLLAIAFCAGVPGAPVWIAVAILRRRIRG